MSAAVIGAAVELGAKLLPPAITVVEELVRAIHGEDQKRAALEQVAELAVRLGAVELPSKVAGDAFDRAVADRTAAAPTVPAAPLSRIDSRTLGQINFEAYDRARGGLTHDGKPTPKWDALGDGVRSGWEAGALEAVRLALEARGT